jgi:adenylate cyclase
LGVERACQGYSIVTDPSHAVFLSYASEDIAAAERICLSLRAAGMEVWFDRNELRGGDAWDRQIRRQIHDCALFIPIVSQHTQERLEGYFRREWKLAIDRTHDIAEQKPFLVPVVVDGTRDQEAFVPDAFRAVQWTRLPGGETPAAFVERIKRLLSAELSPLSAVSRATAAIREPVRATWRSKSVLLAAVAVVVCAALAYFVTDKFWIPKHLTPAAAFAPPPHSIAVLPFVNMSGDKEQEYFSDGLSEEILNLLAGMPSLSVIGRTSSFQFKGKNEDLRVIGAQLGAAYVLEGSVHKAGEHVRVIAQLVSTRDGVHRWSHTYDRPFGDVLKLQDELAAGVARAMQVTVDSDAFLSQAASANPEAYDFYLRGLHALDRRDRESMENAANYFQQALELDARSSAAATQLGRTLVYKADFGFAPAGASYEGARRSLENAIRLDPSFGSPHAWLGWVHMAYDWDWPAADAEIKQALRLSPRDPVVLLCAGRLSESLGHWDEAISLLTSSLARDPLSPGAHNVLSGVYARAGRLAEAEASERRVLEISPTYSTAPHNLAVILVALRRSQEALAVIERATVWRTETLAVIYYSLGRKVESDAELTALTREHAQDRPFSIAEVHAYRGEVDKAFQWLERAYSQKDAQLYLFKGDPLLRNLEPDPRYKAFLLKMKIPE